MTAIIGAGRLERAGQSKSELEINRGVERQQRRRHRECIPESGGRAGICISRRICNSTCIAARAERQVPDRRAVGSERARVAQHV